MVEQRVRLAEHGQTSIDPNQTVLLQLLSTFHVLQRISFCSYLYTPHTDVPLVHALLPLAFRTLACSPVQAESSM
jgi:hypothetical protein